VTPIVIDQHLLAPRPSRQSGRYSLYEKKTLNMHRGVVVIEHADAWGSTDALAAEVRRSVREEFRPAWWRGFAFGAILRFDKVDPNLSVLANAIDPYNRRGGVWQWAVICVDQGRVAIGMHTWLHGYLRPIYDTTLQQLSNAGYLCACTDTNKPQFIAFTEKLDRAALAIKTAGLSEIIRAAMK